MLGDVAKPLLGYRAGDGDSTIDIERSPGETDAALLARAHTAIDGIAGQEIVVSLMEIRGR